MTTMKGLATEEEYFKRQTMGASEVDPCRFNNPCYNGGICSTISDFEYLCLCPDQYSDENCRLVQTDGMSFSKSEKVNAIVRSFGASSANMGRFVAPESTPVNPQTIITLRIILVLLVVTSGIVFVVVWYWRRGRKSLLPEEEDNLTAKQKMQKYFDQRNYEKEIVKNHTDAHPA